MEERSFLGEVRRGREGEGWRKREGGGGREGSRAPRQENPGPELVSEIGLGTDSNSKSTDVTNGGNTRSSTSTRNTKIFV